MSKYQQSEIQRLGEELSKAKNDLLVANASLASAYHFASHGLNLCNSDKYIASGLILTITDLKGKEIVSPVMIRDGMSSEAIDALQKDLVSSFKIATIYKPLLMMEKGND